jgi:cytochrome P450 / NADPH-cytochrome P450 reductase
LIDSTLSDKGAKAITPRGQSDVALGTVSDDFDDWQDLHLWPALHSNTDSSVVSEVDSLDIEISTSTRASHLNHLVQDALVTKNEVLSAPGAAEKRHLEIKLPTNTTYEAGDYIAILPINNTHLIGRVLLRFGLPWDATMTINKGSYTTIPMQQSLSVTVVLGAYVEMTMPATRKNIATILQFANDEATKSSISNLASSTPAPSVLELVEAHPTIPIPFSTYLSMLQPMRIRQYSISSSSLEDPTIASITYAVLDEATPSTTPGDSGPSYPKQSSRRRLGVATSFLRDLPPGSKIQIAIKKSHASFHLPLNDANTPIIMVAAGTGIAPFRGFMQERAVKIAAAKNSGTGVGLAEAVLFLGCRAPDVDFLYREQLEEWERMGAVKVYPAFSRAPELSKGCKYAQDRVWAEREEVVARLFDNGARIYICGSGRLGRGVSEVAVRIKKERGRKKKMESGLTWEEAEVSEEEARAWWEGLRGERFAVDVFD